MHFNSEQVLKNFISIKNKVSAISKGSKLLAVSKFHKMDKIIPLLLSGHRFFGESRLEEAVGKWSAVKKDYPDLELHYIGGVQSKKIPKIVNFFDVIQSVDRISVAEKISSSAEAIDKNQRILIQINIGEEPQKSGVPPDDFSRLYTEIKSLKNIIIEGIMCIPPNDNNANYYFMKMKKIAEEYRLNEISMGMSHDYEQALNHGATIVRVGTFIFGERSD